jgi:hypothetical protein
MKSVRSGGNEDEEMYSDESSDLEFTDNVRMMGETKMITDNISTLEPIKEASDVSQVNTSLNVGGNVGGCRGCHLGITTI